MSVEPPNATFPPQSLTAPSPKPQLYFYSGSSCSWRICIALRLKKIDFEIVEMSADLIKQQSYAEKNPMHKLPALEIDGNILHQTKAIIEYLEETRPDPPLLPLIAKDRWAVRSISDIISSDIQPLQNLAVQKKIHDGNQWAHDWIVKGFEGVEKMLAEHRGKYCFGETITMADIFLYPQIFNAYLYGVNMVLYPHICAVEAALSEHPAFSRS
jgi:maleylacetoacetate isomerase